MDENGSTSPSAFMGGVRPENYSDTEEFEPAVLDNHLETVTARNDTHAFEIFCRKLASGRSAPT